MSERLKRALEARAAANREIQDALQADYSPGKSVNWEFGGRVRRGFATMNCYGERLQVQNIDTGKTLFIHAYRIVDAMMEGR